MHTDVEIMDNSFEVESAPAIVFVKDPGVKPIVYHGMSFFQFLMIGFGHHGTL